MTSKNLIRYLIVFSIACIFGYYIFNKESARNAPPSITFSQAENAIALNLVEKATYNQNSGELVMSLNKDKFNALPNAIPSEDTNPLVVAGISDIGLKELKTLKLNEGAADVRTTLFGNNPEMLKELAKKASLKVVDRPEPTKAQRWFGIIFPIVLMVILFLVISRFLMKGSMGGGSKMFSFGQSKMKMVNPDDNKIRLVDVQGCDEAKAEVAEIIDYLSDSASFTRLGGKVPRGVLMVGPPGTGKTLLAKAIAGEAKVPFFTTSGSDFVEMFVGVGASRVKDMFEAAKKHAPSIIFIDEIDAMGSREGGPSGGGGQDEREQTLNQMLVQMDGFEDNSQVIVIAATNRPEKLDKALRRAGRFDRQVHVGLPDRKGREAILKVHSSKMIMSSDVSLDSVAKITTGFSGAELANLLNEAALYAGRTKSESITTEHLRWARDRVILGSERTSALKNESELEITAVHEVGHALVAHYTKHSDPVCKVSIVPRSNALGVTLQMPKEDGRNPDSLSMLDRIAVLMGGRAAEDVCLGLATAGASNDFHRATQIARAMVATYGMDTQLGPISFDGEHGRNPYAGNGWSEEWNAKVDARVTEILKEQYQRATSILKDHMPLLKKMSEELIRVEDIEEDYFNHIIQTHENGEGFTPIQVSKKKEASGEVLEAQTHLAIAQKETPVE